MHDSLCLPMHNSIDVRHSRTERSAALCARSQLNELATYLAVPNTFWLLCCTIAVGSALCVTCIYGREFACMPKSVYCTQGQIATVMRCCGCLSPLYDMDFAQGFGEVLALLERAGGSVVRVLCLWAHTLQLQVHTLCC